MRLRNVPSEFKAVLRSIRRKAKRHGVNIIISDAPISFWGRQSDSGYFSGDTLAIVKRDRPLKRWFELLLHESCHMDQYFDKKLGTRNKQWDTAYDQFSKWLNHKIELSKSELRNIVDLIIECESDCDDRVVKKIIKWNLPYNIQTYRKEQQDYYASYHIMRKKRVWIN